MTNPTGKGGFQERKHHINKKGRPKNFDAARELAQQIAHEVAKDKGGGPIIVDGHIVTVTEAVLRQWATSRDARLQQAFMEYAYGKPPTQMQVTGKDGAPLVYHVRVVADDESD